jgi:peptide deformylase
MLATDDSSIGRQKPKLLPLFIYPHKILNEVSVEVDQFDESLAQLIADMFISMKHYNGVGLSAVQVGVLKRIIVLEMNSKPLYYVNPKISHIDGVVPQFKWEEGCLSVPGYFEKRERPKVIGVTYQDVDGKYHVEVLEDLHSFAFQHEMDHLNGRVFVDDLSPLKKQMVSKKITKTLKRRRQ